jgi:hypothetical protein
VVIAAALLAAPPARSSPTQYLTVGDRLEAELRVLDLYPRRDLADRLKLPHTGSRPLTLAEIEGTAPPLAGARPAVALSVARLERVLGRDPAPGFVPSLADPATPRLFQRSESGDQAVEVSMGVEGTLLTDKADAGSAVVSGSGVHTRIGVGFDRWLIFTHLVAGRFANGQRIADPIVANTDIIILTEDTYLSYVAGSGSWGASFGRGRWQWGPGEEGSLLLSRTAAPITALSMHGSLESFHLTGTVLNSTLQSSAGEQLAAHRLEWQPFDRLRVGASKRSATVPPVGRAYATACSARGRAAPAGAGRAGFDRGAPQQHPHQLRCRLAHRARPPRLRRAAGGRPALAHPRQSRQDRLADGL